MAFSLDLSRYLEPSALSPHLTSYAFDSSSHLTPTGFSPHLAPYPFDPRAYLEPAAFSPYPPPYSCDSTAPSTPDVREDAFEVASDVSKLSGSSPDAVEGLVPIKVKLLSSDGSKSFSMQRDSAKKPRKVKRNQIFCAHPSRGSKNHERCQCRPCKRFSTPEGCPDGALCNFCHYPHSEDPLQDASACDAEARRALSMLTEDTKQNELDAPGWDEAWYLPMPPGLHTGTAFDSPLLGA